MDAAILKTLRSSRDSPPLRCFFRFWMNFDKVVNWITATPPGGRFKSSFAQYQKYFPNILNVKACQIVMLTNLAYLYKIE